MYKRQGKDRPRHGAPEATAVATAGLLKLDFTAPAQAWLDGQRPNGWMVRAGSMAEGGTIQGLSLIHISEPTRPY